MNDLDPAPVLELLHRQPGELHPLPVEVVGVAGGRSGENLLRHGLGHEAEAFVCSLGVPERFFAVAKGCYEVVVARLNNGWSGPSAIGTGGLGVGFQAGVEVTEFVMVLNTPAAVEAFSKQGNVTLGGNLSVAAGPLGRTAEAGVSLQSAIYSYSISQGFFAGVSLEGTVISVRDDANEAYYGRPVTAGEILSGKVQVPAGARNLVTMLSKY